VRIVRLAGPAAAVILLVGCSAVANYPIVATAPSASCRDSSHKGIYLGVTAPDFPASTVSLTRFEGSTGIHPSLITYSSRFGDSFDVSAACYAQRRGATSVVQLDPLTTSLRYIADGRFDSYLRSYAAKVKEFGADVVISFGPRMNDGRHYWLRPRAEASLFVAAWRHIVEVFRSEGAKNVIWMWTIEAINGSVARSPAPWWPGGDYVGWVGICSYYARRSQTFNSLLNSTISVVRHLTRDPVLLAEIGVAPVAGQAAKIANLFIGIREYGLLGFVWFDENMHRRFPLGISPTAAADFRREAKKV